MEQTYYISVKESVAAAAKRHLALFNGAGSGKVIKVYSIRASGAATVAVTGQTISLSVMRITAAPTGGASVTANINKADTTNAAVPAQITATAAATGGATEEPSTNGVGTISGEETSAGAAVDLYRSYIDGTQAFVIREGEGVLVKQGTLAAAGAVNITITFTLV